VRDPLVTFSPPCHNLARLFAGFFTIRDPRKYSCPLPKISSARFSKFPGYLSEYFPVNTSSPFQVSFVNTLSRPPRCTGGFRSADVFPVERIRPSLVARFFFFLGGFLNKPPHDFPLRTRFQRANSLPPTRHPPLLFLTPLRCCFLIFCFVDKRLQDVAPTSVPPVERIS